MATYSITGFISVYKPSSTLLTISQLTVRDPDLYLGSGRKVPSTTNLKLTGAPPGKGVESCDASKFEI